MTSTTTARICRVEQSLIVAASGAGRIRRPGRRLFLQASGIMVASAALGCENEDVNYILEGLAVAAADVVGVYFLGMPVGTIAANAIHSVDTADSSSPPPPTTSIKYTPTSAQGMGKTFEFNDMPRQSESRGVANLDDRDAGWVYRMNTTDDSINYVRLVDDGGQEVTPNGYSGFLDDRMEWRSGEDLYITGVPNRTYTKLYFQTLNGKQGYLDLA